MSRTSNPVASFAQSILAGVLGFIADRRTATELGRLDAHLLRDIGLTPDDVRAFQTARVVPERMAAPDAPTTPVSAEVTELPARDIVTEPVQDKAA